MSWAEKFQLLPLLLDTGASRCAPAADQAREEIFREMTIEKFQKSLRRLVMERVGTWLSLEQNIAIVIEGLNSPEMLRASLQESNNYESSLTMDSF